jgi:hypothetical protein
MALACLVASRAVAADPPPLSLDWQGPEDCQAGPRVSSEVRRLLGGERAGESLVARVKVARRGRRWHLSLWTEHGGRARSRELDAESCGAGADAVAMILALTIDPSRALGSEEDAGPPPVDAASEPDAVPLAPAPPFAADAALPDAASEPSPEDDRASEETPFPLFAFALAASDTGSLPHTAFAFGGGLGYGERHFQIEALVAYWPSTSTNVGSSAEGGSFTMFVADLRGCALAEAGVFSFGPCAGGGLTRMRAEGSGVTTQIPTVTTWGSIVADALIRARVSRFLSPRLTIGGAVPLSRPIFSVVGLGTVHQPAAIALQIAAGMELHF